ncbi:hypothetical protein [Rhizobium wenxiniae]|uniref:hypothetical protein n=1 Tax=Rhizobium wenxiniae TaxID=1737357 RepID=UPI001C6F50A4|nr:hypothetical protein [Rhizobium wenxiniae]
MENHLTLTALAAAVLVSVPLRAAAIDTQAMNTAQIQSVPLETPQQKPPEPDAAGR